MSEDVTRQCADCGATTGWPFMRCIDCREGKSLRAQFAVALESGGMVVPREHATELLEHMRGGEPIQASSGVVFTFHVGAERYSAAELRAALVNVEAREAEELRAHLATLNPTKWFRR